MSSASTREFRENVHYFIHTGGPTEMSPKHYGPATCRLQFRCHDGDHEGRINAVVENCALTVISKDREITIQVTAGDREQFFMRGPARHFSDQGPLGGKYDVSLTTSGGIFTLEVVL